MLVLCQFTHLVNPLNVIGCIHVKDGIILEKVTGSVMISVRRPEDIIPEFQFVTNGARLKGVELVRYTPENLKPRW